MKVDVLICTKDPAQVRPKLMDTLHTARWTKQIIMETSKPLSRARVNGLVKCCTEWIAMFDDDVEIPSDWFEKVSSLIADGVVAVSSPDIHVDRDYSALQKVAERVLKLSKRDSPFIDNVLLKKSVMDGYDPPAIFTAEDEFFHDYAKRSGRWLHTPPIGVWHFTTYKDDMRGGAAQRIHPFEPPYVILRRILVRFYLSVIAAIIYTHSPKTIWRIWRMNVRLMAGWLMAGTLSKGEL